jgi:MtN3 and saliva related transmembrane protein
MMDFLTILGMLAGTLTTISFLPQVIQTWRSRSCKDVSLGMFVIFGTGVLLWLAYGVLKHDWPVIIANVVTFILAILIVIMKLRFDRNDVSNEIQNN